MDNLGKELAELMWKVSHFTESISSRGIENIQTKDDFSPVTLADYGAQILVSHWLQVHFPGEPLIAEETLKSLPKGIQDSFIDKLREALEPFLGLLSRQTILEYLEFNSSTTQAERYWVLDPLDGTKGFLRGDQYAVSLGHVNRGTIDIGVLACPRLNKSLLPELKKAPQKGCLFIAQKGQGTVLQMDGPSTEPIPIHVSECTSPKKARLLRSYESKHTDLEKTTQFLRRMGISQSIPVDSQVKYGMLACGAGEIVLRFPPPDNPKYREKVWDHAGGSLVLEEAGGKLTDVFGKSFQYNGEPLLKNSVGVFASNGYLHDEGLRVLREIMTGISETEG